jgi:N-acetylneuraminate synthase
MWTETLAQTCKEAGIAFFTSPYDLELVDYIDPFVPAFKIGSGDITWLEMVEHIASKNKPFILATGASSMDEVQRAVDAALRINSQFALLQCNTNYTADLENFKHIQLNVLKSYRAMYPDMVLGLSDHTLGHATVLGAVALGGRLIEKHFTDNVEREGPDHKFSMNPKAWRDMVDATRELENALGTGVKRVENNEIDTAVVQRRSLRLMEELPIGATILRRNLSVLRPCPAGAISPDNLSLVVGKKLVRAVAVGDCIKWTDLE